MYEHGGQSQEHSKSRTTVMGMDAPAPVVEACITVATTLTSVEHREKHSEEEKI